MKLYVGNLPFSVTDDALKKAFSEFGDVQEAVVITNKFSGRSKGFGFVTFSDDDSGKQSGEKAIAEMDGKDFEGRPLKVNEARPKSESSEFRRDRRPHGRKHDRGSGNRERDRNRERDSENFDNSEGDSEKSVETTETKQDKDQ